MKTQHTKTIIRHLRAVARRCVENDLISDAEDTALFAAISVLEAQQPHQVNRAVNLIDCMSGMLKDGECYACGRDGSEPNPECAEHDQEPYPMSGDDAWETMNRLITEAREISMVIESVKRAK